MQSWKVLQESVTSTSNTFSSCSRAAASEACLTACNTQAETTCLCVNVTALPQGSTRLIEQSVDEEQGRHTAVYGVQSELQAYRWKNPSCCHPSPHGISSRRGENRLHLPALVFNRCLVINWTVRMSNCTRSYSGQQTACTNPIAENQCYCWYCLQKGLKLCWHNPTIWP